MADDNKFVLQADIDNALALDALDEIETRSQTLGNSSDKDMKKIGTRVEELAAALQKPQKELTKTEKSLVETFREGGMSVDEFRKKVQQLLGDIKSLGDADPGAIGIGTIGPSEDAGAEGLGRTQEQAEAFIDTTITEAKADEIRAIIDALKNSVTDGAREAALNFEAAFNGAMEAAGGDFLKAEEDIQRLLTKGKQLADGLVEGKAKTQLSEQLGILEADQKLVELRKKGEQLLSSLAEGGAEAGQEIIDSADKLEESFDPENVQQYTKDVKILAAATEKFTKEADKAFKRDVNKDLNLRKARTSFKDLEKVVKELASSGDASAKQLGREIQAASGKWVAAFSSGKIEADKLEKELNELLKTGKKLGEIGEETEKGSDRATRSLWKLGRAADSVGLRGGGNIARIVDGMKGIPIAAVAGIAALAAVAIAIKKIGEAAIAMAKKLASAFAKLVKDSVDVAEGLEIVELQIQNLVGGSSELARVALEKVLELSAQLGTDLSGEFAQIFLPLVDGFEQFEQLGRIASTFAAKTGKDVGEIARALTQSNAEEFRRLARGFGLNKKQIDDVKKSMDELGRVEGLIAGFNQYFEETETGWDTFEGSLRRVKGQIKETFKILQFALGEPVKIALVEQLEGMGKWFKENEEDIKAFFNDIGQAVGSVVTTIGKFVDATLGSLEPGQLGELGVEIKVIAAQISILLESIGGIRLDRLFKGFEIMLKLIGLVINKIQLLFVEVNIVYDLTARPLFDLVSADGMIERAKIIKDLLSGKTASEAFGRLDTLKESQDEVAKLREEWEAEAEARKNAADVDDEAALSEIDNFLALNSLMNERDELLDEIAEATKELTEATAELNKEMARAFNAIFIEEGRRQIDMEIANVEKRLDLLSKHRQNLESINIREDRIDEDRVQDHEDKLEDIDIESARRFRDRAIEAARKQEDLLEKHLRKLKEIREKFDLDAQEAIRLNDAVSLLRIRRRMELELRQEKRRFAEKRDDATEAEERKNKDLAQQRLDDIADADRANARKLRDNELRIKREIEDEQRKYKELLKQQEVEEQRKQEALQVWLDRELEDFNRMWEEKKQDLADDMADTIKIYEDGLREVARINMQIRNLMQRGIGMAGGLPSGFAFAGGGGGGISSRFGVVPQNVGTGGSGGSDDDDDGPSLNHLRATATALASQTNQTAAMINRIKSAKRNWLLDRIREWGAILNGDPQGNQFGGITNPGVSYRVGEDGPETFRPMQHGIIVPHTPMMVAPQSQAAGNISNIDNSRSINADISMLEATQLSPVQITLIRSIVTEQILQEGI